MDQRTTLTLTQDFLLFGCSLEQYSIDFSESSLSPNNTYTVRYTYPNKTGKDVIAEFVRENQLLVKSPPEFDHPCTVQVEVYCSDSDQSMAKFSLDLVSPVEYLFRKYSLDDNNMCSSAKMTGALLAMSLSYYYAMEEQMKKERKADKILATLLTCHRNKPPKYITSVQSASSAGNLEEFAKHHQLQCTLQCLPDAINNKNSPSRQPKLNNSASKTIDVKSVANEGHYTSLINVQSNGPSRQSNIYTSLTTTTDSHYSVPMSSSAQATDINSAPNTHNQKNSGYDLPRQSVAFRPPIPHQKRLERTKSLESILDRDNEYTYIDPRVSQCGSATMARRPAPPRPPPPRKHSASPNKPVVPQRTIAPHSPGSPSSRQLTALGQRNSVPLPPTPKERSNKWWHKDKH